MCLDSRVGLPLMVFLSLVCLAPGSPGSTIPLGARIRGAVASAGEQDPWDFDAVPGTLLSVQLKGQAGLLPLLLIEHLDSGMPVSTAGFLSGAGSPTLKLGRLPLPQGGRYRLVVSGEAGSIGDYSARTKGTWPASALRSSASFRSLDANEEVAISFPAVPGARLKAKLIASGGARKGPRVTLVQGPVEPLIHGARTKTRRKQTKIKQLPLLDAGAHSLRAELSQSGTIKVRLQLLPPRPPRKPVREGVEPFVERAASAVLAQSDDPGAALKVYAQTIGRLYRDAEDPAAQHRSIRASILKTLRKRRDLEALLEASAVASQILTIPNVEPDTESGESGTPLCAPATTVFYINGVLTSYLDAASTATMLRQMVLATMPGQNNDVQVKLFYNQSGLTDGDLDPVCGSLIDWLAFNKADVPLVDIFFDGFIAIAEKLEQLCQALGQSTLMAVAVDLLLESPFQWVQQFLAPPASPSQVTEFRNVIRQQIVSGRKVVIVAHSQGNFYTHLALGGLTSEEVRSVGVVAVASPTSYPGNGAYGYFQQLKLRNDIIGLVPGSPASNLTNSLAAEPFCDWAASNPALAPVCAVQSYLVHGIAQSYLRYPTSRTAVLLGIHAALDAVPAPDTGLGQGFFQATLEWNVAGDIDLHLFEPTGDHVYWSNQVGSVGQLDHDDITGTGPENYYVCRQIDMLPGAYAIKVNNYGGATGTSGLVTVTAGDEFEVYPFTVGEANGGEVLIPIGTVIYHSNGQFTLP